MSPFKNCALALGAVSAVTIAAPAYAAGQSGTQLSISTGSVVAAVLAEDTATTTAPTQVSPQWNGAAQRAFGNGTPESQITTYAGYYNASDGYADRYVAGSFMDWQFGATGVHADLLYVDREQNAAYGALGVSQQIEGFGRIKVMAGTSSHDQDIVPRLFLSAGLDLQPARQLIVRPSVAYRSFRGGRSQVNPSMQFAHYFGGDANGYLVAQADGALFINNTGNTGWSVGGGITQVRTSGWRFGAAIHRGYMTYDAITGTNVHSYTFGGGPNVGYRFASGHELFFRSDLTKTRFYTVSGAIVGLKLPL